MHNEVKEFIEHYLYLIEKGQIDMFIYLAAKEFKDYNWQKMGQLLRILDEIDVDYKAACERLFIEDFKEAATEYAKAPKGGRQIFLNKIADDSHLPLTADARPARTEQKSGTLVLG